MLDWVRYLYCFHDEISKQDLEMDLKAFGLWHPWQIFGPIAVGVQDFLLKSAFLHGSLLPVSSDAEIIEREELWFSMCRSVPRPIYPVIIHLLGGILVSVNFVYCLKEILIGWSHFLYVGVKTVIDDKLHLS